MNFRSVIDVLKTLGYDGYLSAELIQVPDQVTALRRTSEYIRSML